MARFDTNGLDALILDMNEIRDIDDGTVDDMLLAGGEIIKEAHIQEIQSTFSSRTGKLVGSPTVSKKYSGGDSRYVLIYPQGAHHTYHAKGGGAKTAPNAEVGFVHEFGGHGNDATQWMRKADEKKADDAVEAEFAVFDAWHKSHNL